MDIPKTKSKQAKKSLKKRAKLQAKTADAGWACPDESCMYVISV
jgi:hypothetical protein